MRPLPTGIENWDIETFMPAIVARAERVCKRLPNRAPRPASRRGASRSRLKRRAIRRGWLVGATVGLSNRVQALLDKPAVAPT